MNVSTNPVTTLLRDAARAGLQRGQMDVAEQAFRQLLEADPDDLEALLFLADRKLADDAPEAAMALLDRAGRLHPGHAGVLHQLASTHLATGNFAAAVGPLQQVLAQLPRMFIARLRLGIALEQLDRPDEALAAYFTAVRNAQEQGRWLDDATTAPGLRGVVKHAMSYAIAGRKRLFDASLEPLRERYGRNELRRVERALGMYLGLEPTPRPDPLQQPKFLYFPDIPSQPFYPRERFAWHDALEAATATIRDEMLAVLAREQEELEAFLGVQSPEQAQAMLRGTEGRAAAWDAYFFHRHGQRYDAHCASCPQTSALLDAAPLVRIRDHAPETLFSVLRPGTHILPHRGVTNTRLVTHLPLIVPDDCALRVGGHTHSWRQGECVTFDDTFEHEAWNRSGETRVVLILDSWNPDLSEAECAAVTDLVEAIGDFNQSCELPADGG